MHVFFYTNFDCVTSAIGRDGDGSIIEKFCGNNTIPPPVLSPSQHIWLRFRTDGSIVDRGFAITVQFTSKKNDSDLMAFITSFISVIFIFIYQLYIISTE